MDRLKCDIGSVWDKSRSECGASWILRNSTGLVLLHGRSSFNNILSKTDASFESWNWAIESMYSLHFDNIIFSSEDHTLVGALSKPAAWPALKFYSLKLTSMLNNFLCWWVEKQSRQALTAAFRLLIVLSRKICFNPTLQGVFLIGLRVFLIRFLCFLYDLWILLDSYMYFDFMFYLIS